MSGHVAYSHLTVTGVVSGIAALVIFSPPATAQNPPPCAPGDQQCLEQQQREQGAAIARDVVDNVQDGLQRATDALVPERNNGPGIMVLKDGVPWCMPLGQPIPPGAVITSPTGNGVTTYC
ncbi:hypothetical protein ACAG25_14505 [Mycobacterium sp. pV006]|uniref:hypothetical protein n=1 Tax=Mycobacterium sp. pV006 TaxID=3238983 RepID=UPI00351BEA9A